MRVTDRVVAYLAGDLDGADAFEEALFDGRLDGDELTELSTMLVALREAAYLGILDVVVPRSHVDAMRANGYRVSTWRAEPGALQVAELAGDVDLLFVEFVADLEGVDTIWSELCTLDGTPFKRNEPVPLGKERSVSGYCARDLALATARELPEGWMVRLYSREPGGDRLLGEYRTRIVVVP